MSIFRTFATFVGALVLGISSVANAGHNTETDGNDVILAGHDAVAYFTEGKPVEGSVDYTAVYDGAIYRFSSAENRDLFRDAPARYAPQYGGYCAFALSKGALAPTVPEAWTIYQGKLYLNFSLQARSLWAQDIPGNITLAEGYWPAILG